MDGALELGRKGCRYRLHCEQTQGPSCPHGPTLPFDRLDADGRVTASFYACSACRDRKQCNFYLPLSKASQLPGQRSQSKRGGAAAAGSGADLFASHQSCYDKLQLALRQPDRSCQYCHDCDVTLVGTVAGSSQQQPAGALDHVGHRLARLTAVTARRPTVVLSPKENNKSNAQFFFTSGTTDVLVACLRHLKVQRLVCIGTPRLHEAVTETQQQQYSSSGSYDSGGSILNSFLLDLDGRFRHFFGPHEFAQYNMFNHHFFAGSPAEQSFTEFCASGSGKAAIVVDPPYGGMLEALDVTLRKVTGLLAAGGARAPPSPDAAAEVAGSIAVCFLFLPYYLEPQVHAHLDGFRMLDYRAGYENHAKYSNRREATASRTPSELPPQRGCTASMAASRSSPARIFTNVRPDLVELPAAEGYRFCIACRRWTWPENKHCVQCNACTTKHGPAYVHCPECNRCVKPSWKHCTPCGKCVLRGEGSSSHTCGQADRVATAGPRRDGRLQSGKRRGSDLPAEQPQRRRRKRLQKRQKTSPS